MKKYLGQTLTAFVSSLVVVSVVSAATTISTNISTGGQFSVTGTSTLATSTFSGYVGIGTTTPNNLLSVYDLIDFNNTDSNTKVGYQAGKNIVSGANLNTFFGYQAGFSSSTASTNVATWNTGVGYGVFHSNTTGNTDTVLGMQAFYNNTTGSQSVAIGNWALLNNTTGGQNNAIGMSALSNNTTGSTNSAFARYALLSNTTGGSNVAVGDHTIFSNTTGSANTAVGNGALYDLNITANDGTGNNTAFGYQSGRGIVTGVNNTIIGANVTLASSTLSNNIIIADGSGNRRINVDNSGNVGLGSTTPVANTQIANATNATTTLEVGVGGRSVGSCIKLYRTDGSAIYGYVAASATTLTLTTTPCATVTGF